MCWTIILQQQACCCSHQVPTTQFPFSHGWQIFLSLFSRLNFSSKLTPKEVTLQKSSPFPANTNFSLQVVECWGLGFHILPKHLCESSIKHEEEEEEICDKLWLAFLPAAANNIGLEETDSPSLGQVPLHPSNLTQLS